MIPFLGQDNPTDLQNYSFERFEADMQSFKPRAFDTYILPAFIMYFAIKAKSMPKTARRMLFVGGIYMAYRNYAEYKKLVKNVSAYLKTPGIATGGNASDVEAKSV